MTSGRSCLSTKTTLLAFLDKIEQMSSETNDRDQGIYLLGIHGSGDSRNTGYCPVQRHPKDGGRIQPPLIDDIPRYGPSKLFDAWKMEDLGNYHNEFFLSSGLVRSELHYDGYDNFYVQVTGSKRYVITTHSQRLPYPRRYYYFRWIIIPSEYTQFLRHKGGGTYSSFSPLIPHLGVFDGACTHGSRFVPYVDITLRPGKEGREGYDG